MKALKPILVAVLLLGVAFGMGTAIHRSGANASTTTTWWVPPTNSEWQWYLNGALDTSNSQQMGLGKTAWNGDTPPATNPTVYDIDGIDNSAATVSTLHSLGYKVVCYMEVGTAGNYGGDYTTYYDELQADHDLGNKLSGYPENFININDPKAVAIVESIISQQCSAKGFDGVETDLDETFGTNEGNTGFNITEANEVAYLTTLSTYIHSLGMAWIAKNPDDTDNQAFVNSVEPMADAVITEQCNQYTLSPGVPQCSLLQPFMNDGKAIFNAEYGTWAANHLAKFCTYDNSHNINGMELNVNLNGKTRVPCQ